MYKKILLCFCSAILLAGSTFSQNNPLISIPITPPTAASLGKFVDIPVNYSTGIPDITIPIYTVKEGPLQLPISLSYHASGLKVMEQAGWVGAGWALNAGGVITRSVKGQPDEEVSPSNHTSYIEDKGYYSYLFRQGGDEEVLDYLDFGGGRKDGEPDLYFFNFNGYSGKFYFRADNTIAILPEQDIRIRPLTAYPSGIDKLYGWVITTPDGVEYHFGKTPDVTNDVDGLEHSTPYSFDSGITFTKMASSWYLYRIVSADGQFKINLTYEPEEYSFYAMSLFPSPSGSSSGMGLIKNFVRGVRLRSIQSSNGIVDFIPEDVPRQDLSYRIGFGNPLVDTDNQPNDGLTPKALKEIRIHGAGNNPCRSFGFSYSYFTSSAGLTSTYGGISDLSYYNLHTDKKRLRLNTVVESSCDKTVSKPPYRFDYYDELFVPRTLSLAQDHWGFYNGANNTELVPHLSLDGGFLFSMGRGANRESAWPQMRAGALKKIQYPTGGSSEFEFGAGKVTTSKVTEKVEPLHQYDVTARGNSIETSTSTKHTIVVTGETTIYKVKVETFNGGDGVVFLGTHQFGSGEHSVALAPGPYEWYAQVSGSSALGSHQGIMGKIAKKTRLNFQELVTIGGLRVEKITFQNSRKEPALITTYRYKDWRGTDQATLYSRPNYISLVRNDRMKASGVFMGPQAADHSDGCIVVDSDGKLAYFVSPASIHPMQTTQGYHLGYAQVDVVVQNNGYTRHRFQQDKNPDNLNDVCIRIINQKFCDQQAPNYPPGPEDPDFSRGELRSVGVYDVSGKLLRETHYETEYTFEQSGTHGLRISPYTQYLLATEYELKTARKKKSSVLELSFDALSNEKLPIASLTETLYSSVHHQFPVQTTTFNVTGFTADERKIATAIKGEVINETRKTYAGDLRLPSCPGENTCTSTRTQQEENAFSAYDQQKAGCQNDAFCMANAWVAYARAINDIRINWVDCLVNQAHAYRNCAENENTYLAASPELKAVIDLNKIYKTAEVLETTQWREDKLVGGSYVTYESSAGNRRSVTPLQQHLLVTHAPVAANEYQALSNTDQSLTKDGRYEPEYTYRFEKGNPTEITGRDGVVTAFIWGHDNTLPVVKATGISYAILHAAYQAVNGDVMQLRQRDELKRALLTTYTYDALGLLTSQTDPNGRTTTYVYDGLGREKQLKDAEGNIVRHFDYQYKN